MAGVGWGLGGGREDASCSRFILVSLIQLRLIKTCFRYGDSNPISPISTAPPKIIQDDRKEEEEEEDDDDRDK